jgi:hypothetical protein
LFPFIRKTKSWNSYDYYQTVEENARGGTYEAIWLVKDNYIKDRISSFYYSNYLDLKKDVKTDYKGELAINSLQQLGYLLGLKIKKCA